MKSLHILLCLVIASFCILSCNKDSQESTFDNSDVTQSKIVASIFGVVIDQNDRPVKNALVSFDDNTTLTDVDGVYIFNDVSIGNRHNSLKIEKDGFFDGARTFRSTSSATQYQVTKLLAKAFDQSFDTSTGGDLTVANQTIQFAPNSIVFENNGSAYTGTVKVAMSPIAADAEERDLIMPGDLSALNQEGTITTLESYGMINVELRSPSGEKLQIASGQAAILGIVLNDKQLQTAPQTIDLWSFDFESGLWNQEGAAILDGNTYTGEVTHFSSWNYDISLPSVIVEGRILNDMTAFPFASISIHNANGAGVSGNTDAVGRFSGRVPMGEELTLKIKDFNCGVNESIIFEKNIGVLTENTNLGEIELNIDNGILQILATAVDCDLEQVADGRLRTDGFHIYPFSGSQIDIQIPVCNTGITNITFQDVVGLEQVTINDVAFPGVVDLGEVTICGDQTDFISVEGLDGGTINAIDSLGLYTYTNNTDDLLCSILGFNVQSIDDIQVYLRFVIGNAFAMDDLEEETYDLGDSRIDHSDDSGFSRSFTNNGGTATITSITTINDKSDRVTGFYAFEGQDTNTGEVLNFSGNFQLVRFY